MLEEEQGVNVPGATPTSNDSETPQKEVVNEQTPPAQSTGNDIPAGKTYSEEQLQDIIHKRTKEYSEKMRSIEAELNQYKLFGSPKDLISKVYAPAKQTEAKPEMKFSPEDERARGYMLKLFPQLKNIDNWEEKLKNYDDISNVVSTINNDRIMSSQAFVENSRASLGKMCEDAGIKDVEKQGMIEEMVATIIKTNPGLTQKFVNRDMSCIEDAFNIFKSFGGYTTPKQPSKEDVAATKLRTAALSKTLPKGGAPSAVREKKKLTDEERLDQAFKSVSNGNGE